jgi:tetratricopeptide (TPR) repeat protein
MHCYKNHHELCKEEYGSMHEMTSGSYSNLARVHHYLKEYDQAIELCKKSNGINEELFGLEDVCVAQGCFYIGLVYIEKKKWEKALEYLERSRQIYEKRYGMEYNRTAKLYNSIGEVHAEKGDYNTAMKFLDDTLEIHKKKTIENHDQSLEAAATYKVIGRVHEKKGDIVMALNYYSRSFHIYEKVHGVNNPYILKVYKYTSSAYGHKGDAAKALEFFQKARQEKEIEITQAL